MNDKYIRTIETQNEQETLALGKFMGKVANPGDTICLTGDLGSGKTVITRGVACGIGINEGVTSPTFTLLNIYYGHIPMYHFDVYRLESPENVLDIGFYDYIGNDGVALIEWADLIEDYLPSEYVRLDIKRDFETGNDHRMIDIYQKGEGMKETIDALERWGNEHDHISS
ncbi:MAG TPA: tRNA (adenosine(37)-N6)-threonylcarbamoyltransferase complex ATPase subunit type 1 TsaE [Clostridiales bacterium]|nr:tRNA (adenosine(37)-N6)-threonylcarbamoyltransferase complex ATPase subunit type 1 TsaE [Clostridiales bacterium]